MAVIGFCIIKQKLTFKETAIVDVLSLAHANVSIFFNSAVFAYWGIGTKNGFLF